MIPLSATLGYSTLLERLSDSALLELDRVMASVSSESPKVQREALMDLLPLLGDQYVGASSLVSAEFFTELQAMNEIRKPIAAEVLEGVDTGRWHSLARWGTQPSIFEQGGAALVYSMLAGGLTKILTESAADTMIGNAELQGDMRSQRVPRPGCCAFCGVLASRFAGYTSEASAGTVTGRGVPLGKGRGKGVKGRGGGIKTRGSRAIGEKFHDYCRCRIVVVTEKNEVELQAGAEKYYDSYRDAYEKADEGLVRVVESYKIGPGDYKNKYSWATNDGKPISPEGRTKMIIAAMREDLGVK
ncbi:hypothetical protein BLJ79_21570 [Arthrobacter sp. UCD-GKA]|uniref:VG15 protein n=1 Tax=Arthrobacter sp. UCD-GKA TaxID=1913576 RepID=UPI0008DC75E4|nr:hypothetical protein [Arthrobacter sp. UCD-GKA]OIH81950.1 hypothetical protein BLJ79_21570 [Arthrobacter sp. UCD-GKA]